MSLADAPQWLVSTFVRSAVAVGATAERDEIRRTAGSLVTRWQEPERKLHNLRHLIDVLARVEELAEETHVPDVVRLAAWYHGAVFNASAPVAYARRGGEDSVASAALAREELAALGVPDEVTDRVHELIVALDRHEADEHDVDALALCDADLGILAVEPQRYAAYRRAIREEYAHIPERDYVASRIVILGRLLQRRRLFVSPFSLAWEEPARENLAAELSHLRARLAVLGGAEPETDEQPARPHSRNPTSWPRRGPVAPTRARSDVPATGRHDRDAAPASAQVADGGPSRVADGGPGDGPPRVADGGPGDGPPQRPAADKAADTLSGIEREPEFEQRRRARLKRRRDRSAAQPPDEAEPSPSALFRPPPQLPRS